jgi:hypothetical protein
MKDRHKTKSRIMDINRYLLTFIAIWTAGVILSLGWNIYQLQQSMLSAARTSAKISYDKDLIYRRWVARQGGVYVPVSEMTPPNPYLKVPYRDIKTTDHLSLTLINPAYMTRQVNEMAMEHIIFRDTSPASIPSGPRIIRIPGKRRRLSYSQ